MRKATPCRGLSYSVAHHLRAPLRSLNGFSRALVGDWGDKLDQEANEHLARISAGATRLRQLIDALLSLARESRTELVRGNVNLSQVAHAVIGQLRTGEPSRVVDFVVQDGLLAPADLSLSREPTASQGITNGWRVPRPSEGGPFRDESESTTLRGSGLLRSLLLLHDAVGGSLRIDGGTRLDPGDAEVLGWVPLGYPLLGLNPRKR